MLQLVVFRVTRNEALGPNNDNCVNMLITLMSVGTFLTDQINVFVLSMLDMTYVN